MKKLLAIFLVLALGGLSYLFFSSSKPAEVKPSFTKDKILSLEALGLTKSKEYMLIENYDQIVHPDLVKKYVDGFKLQYISDAALNILMTNEDLILGQPGNYIGHLDFNVQNITNSKLLITTMWHKHISDERERLTDLAIKEKKDIFDSKYGGLYLGLSDNVVTLPAYSDGEIYIVAPKDHFSPEDAVNVVNRRIVPRDPILLQTVPEGGYVILAKW